MVDVGRLWRIMYTIYQFVADNMADGNVQDAKVMIHTGMVSVEDIRHEAEVNYHFDYLNVGFNHGYRQQVNLDVLKAVAEVYDDEAAREFVDTHQPFTTDFVSQDVSGIRPPACCAVVIEAYWHRDRKERRNNERS